MPLKPTIGVTYRDDGRGKAHQSDLALVRQANPTATVVSVKQPTDVKHLDALFVPGGPHDHPDAVASHQTPGNTRARGRGASRRPGGADRTAEVNARHDMESTSINSALNRNMPVLAVCGGSWRLASCLGGQVRALSEQSAHLHAGSMQAVTQHRHDVTVGGDTKLAQILRSPKGSDPFAKPPTKGAAADIPMSVNSVHWESSHFAGQATPVQITAKGPDGSDGEWRAPALTGVDTVVEAYASTNHHYVHGIQWHPEYAMNHQLDETPSGLTELNAKQPEIVKGSQEKSGRIMSSLGDAALTSKAARIIQRNFRNRKTKQIIAQKAATRRGNR